MYLVVSAGQQKKIYSHLYGKKGLRIEDYVQPGITIIWKTCKTLDEESCDHLAVPILVISKESGGMQKKKGN